MLRRREGRGLMPRVGIFGLTSLDNKFFRYVCRETGLISREVRFLSIVSGLKRGYLFRCLREGELFWGEKLWEYSRLRCHSWCRMRYMHMLTIFNKYKNLLRQWKIQITCEIKSSKKVCHV